MLARATEAEATVRRLRDEIDAMDARSGDDETLRLREEIALLDARVADLQGVGACEPVWWECWNVGVAISIADLVKAPVQ